MASPAPASSPPANSTSTPPPSTPTTPSAPPPSSTPTTPSAPPPSTPTTPPPSTPTTPPPVASNPPPPSPPIPTVPPPTVTPSTPPTTPATSPPPAPGSALSPPAPSPPTTPSSGSTPAVRSPPPGRPSPSSPSRPSDSSPSPGSGKGVQTPVIVGVVIAGVVIVAILGIVCLLCTRKKKRNRNQYGDGGYYPHPPPQHPPGPKDGHYGVQAQQWQQNYPPPSEHYQVANPAPPAGPPRPPKAPSPPLQGPPYISSGGPSGSSFGSENPQLSPGISLGSSKSMFSYEELALATNGFSESNLLGQGGFGYVHKGVLPNGKEVAVKALKAGSGQGEREFQAEVEIISRVHHRYLVSLVGYCMTGSKRLLVYEFVPNGTLEFHLHGKGRPPMDWPMRLKIALGAAKGLAYLHEDCHPKIIHRDIKSANILVDYKFEAKVADFGLAKLSSDANTHISTRVMGTFGYMAPEYASSGKLTEKSDVYSFGVMLLELLTGRRPVDQSQTYVDDSLVDWARPLLTKALEENNFDSLVDQRLENNFSPNEMARMVACAAACVRHSAKRRPRMSQVVRALEGEASLSDLNEGVKPGQSSIYSSYGSSDYDNAQYKEDMKRFRQMALASQEHGGSSEYGGTTSEYGANPSVSSSEAQTTREMEVGVGKIKTDSRGFSGSSDV